MQASDREKASYETALANWRNNLTSEDIRRQNSYISAQKKKGRKTAGRLRDPSKPKLPKSGFLHYLEDLRSSDPSLYNAGVIDAARKAGASWKNLSAQEKEVRTLLTNSPHLISLHSPTNNAPLVPGNSISATLLDGKISKQSRWR